MLERCCAATATNAANSISKLLDDFNFRTENRMKVKENVKEFWTRSMYVYPELFKLASVIFSISPNEVATDLSTLNFVLNKFRNSLTDESLQQIMFVKLNEELFLNA